MQAPFPRRLLGDFKKQKGEHHATEVHIHFVCKHPYIIKEGSGSTHVNVASFSHKSLQPEQFTREPFTYRLLLNRTVHLKAIPSDTKGKDPNGMQHSPWSRSRCTIATKLDIIHKSRGQNTQNSTFPQRSRIGALYKSLHSLPRSKLTSCPMHQTKYMS